MRQFRCGTGWMLAVLLLSGCVSHALPERSGAVEDAAGAVRAYRDYVGLERRGAEQVRLKSESGDEDVPLPYYLFMLAGEFERLGNSEDAVKLYLRLLTHYPLMEEEESQLGIMAENRLRWLLGDKRWILRESGELTARLAAALAARDTTALQRIMSRDFGLGSDADERYAVDYREGLKMIRSSLDVSPRVTVDAVEEPEPGRVLIKTSGWHGEHAVWYFGLRHLDQPEGWEWDLAYWDEEN